MAMDVDGLEELIVIRWFDHGRYTGSTYLRVANTSEREPGKRAGGDMQIIQLEKSCQDEFNEKAGSKNIGEYNFLLKGDDGKFKGEYRKKVTGTYKSILDRLAKDDLVKGRRAISHPALSLAKVYFDYDADKFSVRMTKENLDKVKHRLGTDPERMVRIEGFSSSENKTGDPSYNMKLSQRRADALKQYLIDNGVDESRILFSDGKGGSGGTSEAEKQENRRADIIFSYEYDEK